jgi:hypothetical protein
MAERHGVALSKTPEARLFFGRREVPFRKWDGRLTPTLSGVEKSVDNSGGPPQVALAHPTAGAPPARPGSNPDYDNDTVATPRVVRTDPPDTSMQFTDHSWPPLPWWTWLCTCGADHSIV